MEKYCISCGMPLKKSEDIAVETEKGPLCKFCVNEDGSPKDCMTVFNGGVEFFNNSVPDTSKELAERITRKNMKRLPMWEGSDCECFKGEVATDEEFQNALDKLHKEIKKGNVDV